MNNKQFMKMSKARRKVALARDVLKQLAAKKITSEGAGYFGFSDDTDKTVISPKQQLKTFSKKKECRVCALGALFKCKLDMVNNLTIGDLCDGKEFETINHIYADHNDITKYLLNVFSIDEMYEIENFFENSYRWAPSARRDERMRLIMENIIIGKGKFDPQREPIYNDQIGGWLTPGFKG